MPDSASRDTVPPRMDRAVRRAPPRGATEVRTETRRDPRADPTSVHPTEDVASNTATPRQAAPKSDAAGPSAAFEVRLAGIEQALSETQRRVEEARSQQAAVTTATEESKLQLEKFAADLASAIGTAQDLTTKLLNERDDRIAALAHLKAEHEGSLAQLRQALADAVRVRGETPAVAETSVPHAPRAVPATPKMKAALLDGPTLPIYRVPEPPPRRSFLRAAVIKVALFAGVGGTLVVTEGREVGRVAAKLVNMPKDAATHAAMANIQSIVQADFVETPLPAPEEFDAYLKGRVVGNADKADIDGWGTQFRLDVSPSALRSAGPDRTFDTADDIVLELGVKSDAK